MGGDFSPSSRSSSSPSLSSSSLVSDTGNLKRLLPELALLKSPPVAVAGVPPKRLPPRAGFPNKLPPVVWAVVAPNSPVLAPPPPKSDAGFYASYPYAGLLAPKRPNFKLLSVAVETELPNKLVFFTGSDSVGFVTVSRFPKS